MKLLLLVFSMLFSVIGDNPLLGRWETKPSVNGVVTGIVFKGDGKLEAYVNKKPFVSGVYTFNPKDSTLIFSDNGCDGATGIYKIVFYSNSDSFSVRAISDTCIERKKGMERLVMGRTK